MSDLRFTKTQWITTLTLIDGDCDRKDTKQRDRVERVGLANRRYSRVLVEGRLIGRIVCKADWPNVSHIRPAYPIVRLHLKRSVQQVLEIEVE